MVSERAAPVQERLAKYRVMKVAMTPKPVPPRARARPNGATRRTMWPMGTRRPLNGAVGAMRVARTKAARHSAAMMPPTAGKPQSAAVTTPNGAPAARPV